MEKSKKNTAFIALTIAYTLMISIMIVLRIGGEAYFKRVSDTIAVITPIFPIFFGYLAYRHFGKTLQGKSVLFITLSCLVWMIADIIWLFTDSSVVSIADIFYWLGYGFFLAGVFFTGKMLAPSLQISAKKKIMICLVAIIAFVAYFYFFPVIWSNELSAVENISTSMYTIVDFVLILSIIMLVFFVILGSFSLPWIIIGLGALCNLIGDIFYAANYGTYAAGDLVDLTW
jgi:hypothetical protein